MNQYFGAWHGPREALAPRWTRSTDCFPDKMVIISEFGFPGIFARNAAEADAQRVAIFREQLPELARRDWIAGAILWCYQDYKSRRNLWPGQEERLLEHGIVDENRQRKPSYFVWKELNEPARIEARWSEVRDGAPGCLRDRHDAEQRGPTAVPSAARIPRHLAAGRRREPQSSRTASCRWRMVARSRCGSAWRRSPPRNPSGCA